MFALLLATLAITLPVDPPATRTMEFEEQWRTDPYSDEYLMGNVMTATIDDDGNVYFLDAQLQEVLKFDVEGNYVATIARKGEGPGELENQWSITWWPPDALILPRAFPPKVVRIAPDGTPLDELHVYRHEGDDTKASINLLVPAGEYAVVQGSLFQFSADGNRITQWIGVIDRLGTVVHEFASKEQELPADPLNRVQDEVANYWEWDRWTVSPDGHVFRVPDREKWLIERYDLEGNLTATFERDIPSRPRTDEEIEEMKSGNQFFFNGQEAKITYKLLDTEPPIRGLGFIDGHLWVFHNPAPDELPEGVWRRASVLTVDGEYVEDLDIVLDHDEEQDTARMLRDGWMMVVENGVAAMESHFAGFGGGGDSDEDEDLSDAEPAEIVIYRPKN